jgi:hypothetical protein
LVGRPLSYHAKPATSPIGILPKFEKGSVIGADRKWPAGGQNGAFDLILDIAWVASQSIRSIPALRTRQRTPLASMPFIDQLIGAALSVRGVEASDAVPTLRLSMRSCEICRNSERFETSRC